MSRKPKHQAISSQLRAEIASGRFGPNDRLPSETQLVATFGVSRPTAARALRDLQAEGLIERRAGSGTYLRTGAAEVAATRQLGLLVPGLETTEIFGLICGELASRAGRTITACFGAAPPVRTRTPTPARNTPRRFAGISLTTK